LYFVKSIYIYNKELANVNHTENKHLFIFSSEMMGIGKRSAEIAESRAKSLLTDDEVTVSFNADDPACLNKVSFFTFQITGIFV